MFCPFSNKIRDFGLEDRLRDCHGGCGLERYRVDVLSHDVKDFDRRADHVFHACVKREVSTLPRGHLLWWRSVCKPFNRRPILDTTTLSGVKM